MTSLQTSTRQVSTDDGYFIPIASCINRVYGYNPAAGSVPFSSAQWAGRGELPVSKFTSSLLAGAGILRDLGKTVVSSGRTFRKVQLVTSSVANTFGVGGGTPSGTGGYVEDYLTGYIEIGLGDPTSTPAPVAKYGR
jgi:hypothetical protein